MGFDPAALRDSTATQALAEIARLARMATSGAVPDAIRRCRRLAAAMEAGSFALFFAGRGADAGPDADAKAEADPKKPAEATS